MSLYSRVTRRGLGETTPGIAISALFAEMTRYQRGTRTQAEVQASLGLSAAEWTDALVLLGKVAGVGQQVRLGVDVERFVSLLQYDRDLTGSGYGITSWQALLDEVDAWIATGAYD